MHPVFLGDLCSKRGSLETPDNHVGRGVPLTGHQRRMQVGAVVARCEKDDRIVTLRLHHLADATPDVRIKQIAVNDRVPVVAREPRLILETASRR